MPACLSQITMRKFWEKPWPCDGKYPIDFTRIGFHPIKRALARFTGMLCLLHAALVTTSSCKLSLSYVLWQPHLLWGGEHKGSAGAAAASHAWLLPALLAKQVQKAASPSTCKKINTCTRNILPFRQFYSSHQGLSRSQAS